MIGSNKGFTLVELLAVLAVLGIVLVIAVPSSIGIYNLIKNKALEEKVEIIEEAAISFGERKKEEVVKSIYRYQNTLPCKSIKLSELVPNYLNKDTEEECMSNNENTVGCIIDPRDKESYLDNTEVIIYYKNKRIYSVVDINDELICESSENEVKIKEFYIGTGTEEYVTKSEVNVTITWDSEKITHYCISNIKGNKNCVWQEVSGNSVKTKHTLTTGDGEKTIYAYIKDKFGNISEEVSDSIYFDNSAPTDNSVLINNGATSATSTSVTLTLSSNGATEMCISNTSSCNDWITYATSKSWTLTTGDGTKTIYVWYRDKYGNATSNYVTDTISLDTTAPTNNSVSINSNATYTTSTNVTLTLSSTGASQMCISNTTSCSNWETYTTSKSWTLNNSTNGTKTVYVWYRDTVGNTTSSYVSDNITLDTAAPTNNSVRINSNATYTTSTSVTLTLASTGASKMCISNTTSCSSWVTYSTSKSHTLTTGDGTKTVYVWYKDTAGNTSSRVSDSIILDTTNPTVSASSSNNNSSSPKVTFSSNEAGTYCVNTSSSRTNMSSCIASGSISANSSITTGGLSANTYYVHIKDSAGNIGVSSGVTLKVASPFGQYLVNNPTLGLNTSTSYAGMYRYRGETVNNYVKLGSVLYRVIGVTSEANSALGLERYQVKLMKAEPVTTEYYWANNSTQKDTWQTSRIYSYLQSSSVLGNTSVIPSGWSSKIDSVKWYTGNIVDYPLYVHELTINQIYSNAQRSVTTTSSKIALIYTYDWCLAHSLSMSNTCDVGIGVRNWIDPNDCINNKYCNVMTMLKDQVCNPYCYDTWDTDDFVSGISVDDKNSYITGFGYGSYRNFYYPVFYLLSSVNYVSGTGTASDPFIIS